MDLMFNLRSFFNEHSNQLVVQVLHHVQTDEAATTTGILRESPQHAALLTQVIVAGCRVSFAIRQSVSLSYLSRASSSILIHGAT
jgi:hypothetical protein